MMMRTRVGLGATAVALAGLLAGCGGATVQATSPGGNTPAAPTQTSSPELSSVALGIAQVYEGQTVTVSKVTCGLTELKDGAEDPSSYKPVPAVADPGSQFCRVDGMYLVSGKKPQTGWMDFGNLVTSDGTEYAEDDKAEKATMNINRAMSGCAPHVCSTLNPGKQIPIVKIYQVPLGITAAYVNYPWETAYSTATYRFAATPTTPAPAASFVTTAPPRSPGATFDPQNPDPLLDPSYDPKNYSD